MKLKILFSVLTGLFLSGIAQSQTIEGYCYELLNSSPWSQSSIVSDTTESNLKLKKISGVKIKVIQDWNRFADDNKGKNFKEFEIKVDSNGYFKINFDIVDKSKLIIIEAMKAGYLRLQFTLRMNNFPFSPKVKIIMVPLVDRKKKL